MQHMTTFEYQHAGPDRMSPTDLYVDRAWQLWSDRTRIVVEDRSTTDTTESAASCLDSDPAAPLGRVEQRGIDGEGAFGGMLDHIERRYAETNC